MTNLVDYSLLALLAVLALAVARLRSLFAIVALSGIYSLVCAALYTVLDGQDVAFTEAAVGAGISTILALGTLHLVGAEQKEQPRFQLLPFLIVCVTGAALIYGAFGLPEWGSPDNPIHQHVAPRYLIDSVDEMGVQNTVTSVLGSYRGFDTMGETAVVFAAMLGVISLIAGSSMVRRRGKGEGA